MPTDFLEDGETSGLSYPSAVYTHAKSLRDIELDADLGLPDKTEEARLNLNFR